MKTRTFLGALMTTIVMASCAENTEPKTVPETQETTDFEWIVEDFSDLRVLRYQIPGWEQLSLQQQKLVYYLTQAGYEGRDIIWDQNYRHNITIRKALENVVRNYQGDRESEEWKKFMEYTKRIWFSNGIHHHYANYKFTPEFSKDYFQTIGGKRQTNRTRGK